MWSAYCCACGLLVDMVLHLCEGCGAFICDSGERHSNLSRHHRFFCGNRISEYSQNHSHFALPGMSGEQHDDASPETTHHNDADPETADHDAANPETVDHDDDANPETADHDANPETADHDDANPETADHDAADLETADHDDDDANPETADHDANPETVNHDDANPETADHNDANSETADHDDANPETADHIDIDNGMYVLGETDRSYDTEFTRHQWPEERRRNVNCMRRPWMLPAWQLENLTGMRINQFWELVWLQKQGRTQRPTCRSLNTAARVLLYRHKMRSNPDFRDLAAYFQIGLSTVHDIFWTELCTNVLLSSSLPLQWFGNPTEVDKNAVYASMKGRESPIHRELLSYFSDSEGGSRLPVGVSLDSKKVRVQNSMDYECQKDAYYPKKGGHCVTFSTLVDTTGYVVLTLPVAAAATPRCGDSSLTGVEIGLCEIEANGDVAPQGLLSLLQGTQDYFVILAVDKGYIYVPHNVSRENITNLKQWCSQNGCRLIWPSDGEDDILQVGANGQIEMIASPNDPVLTKNSRTIVGKLRFGVEQFHGAIADEKILDMMPYQYLQPLGENFCNKYSIPNEYVNCPRIFLIWLAAVSHFNQFHPKFNIKFVNDQEQIRLAMLIKHRLNITNFLHDPSITLPPHVLQFPSARSIHWNNIVVRDIGQLRASLGLPSVSVEDIYEFTLGPYLVRRGCSYITHCKQLEVSSQMEQFSSIAEYWETVKELPATTPVYFTNVNEIPNGWNSDNYFPWPESGVTIVTMKLPSANRTNRNPGNLKRPILVFAESCAPRNGEFENYLGFTGPLAKLCGWTCGTASSTTLELEC